MTLVEASFEVIRALMQIAALEGRMPHVVGVHSVMRCDHTKDLASVWLDLDEPNANAGMGVLMLHIDERDVLGMDHDDIMAALLDSPSIVSRVLQ